MNHRVKNVSAKLYIANKRLLSQILRNFCKKIKEWINQFKNENIHKAFRRTFSKILNHDFGIGKRILTR